MRLTLILLLLLAVGCADTVPADHDAYGEPVMALSAVAVEAVVADSALYVGEDVTMAGTVHAVCQMKGCWLTLQGIGGEHVRVDVARTESGDYAFTVPTDVSGRRAVARGRLQHNRIDSATQHHYSEDAGQAMDVASLSMVAYGVLIAPQ